VTGLMGRYPSGDAGARHVGDRRDALALVTYTSGPPRVPGNFTPNVAVP
jgi:hypothetical protein